MDKKPLNQYAISEALGSTVKVIGSPSFGGFGLLRTTAEILKGTARSDEDDAACGDWDAGLVAAFEEIRDGLAPDRLLWDRRLARRFAVECRRKGIELRPPALVRRLIAIRKSPHKARAKGIVLSPTTRKETHPAPRDQDVCAIEYALVRLRYRYGASIDDILIEPELGKEFEGIATQLSSDSSSQDLRRGALYLRKTRNLKKKQLGFFRELDLDAFEAAMSDRGPLSGLRLGDLPEEPGVIRITEPPRYLFVADPRSLRDSMAPFLVGRALDAMADAFWRPDPTQLRLGLFVGDTFNGVPVAHWELKLIHDRQPVFNWPVRRKVA